MKPYLLTLSFTLLALTAISQIQFESGYFIDNSDRRVECLIKNIDWKSNPTDFEYKLSEQGKTEKTDMASVKEFGIGDKIKFIRKTVLMDNSSSRQDLDSERNPDFSERTVFIRAVIEGEYNLYSYEGSKLLKFFFGRKSSPDISQLVYKKYRSSDGQLRTNNLFKQQILNELKCSSITTTDIENLTYTESSLGNVFIRYNRCVESNPVIYNEKSLSFFQIQFEPGYFIDNEGQITRCLIRNIDRKNNPDNFEYKLSEAAGVKKADITSVKEFNINERTKFIRSTVNIDRSSTLVSELSLERNPEFNEEQLFLEVLIEGDYNLYYYEASNFIRFFYNQKGSENIEQLVFKEYVTDEKKIRQNNLYKQQLLNSLTCPTITRKEIESLTYSKKSLVDLFVKYNQCTGSELVSYEESGDDGSAIKITLRPRINTSSFSYSPDISFFETDFGSNANFGVGLELEFVLPFNDGRWAIVFEPNYHSFSSESRSRGGERAVLNYSIIEIHASMRHYLSTSEDFRAFTNLSLIFNRTNDFSIKYGTNQPLSLQPSSSIGFGFGAEIKTRYIAEIKYQSRLNNENSKYSNLSLIFGYRIKNK